MILITGMSVIGCQWCVRAHCLIVIRFDESDFAEVSKAATSRISLLVSRIQCKWMGMMTLQVQSQQ
jgi:hypothetical protein